MVHIHDFWPTWRAHVCLLSIVLMGVFTSVYSHSHIAGYILRTTVSRASFSVSGNRPLHLIFP